MSLISRTDAELRSADRPGRDVSLSTLHSLVQLIDLKDFTTGIHSSRVVAWSVALSKLAGLSNEETHHVEIAAALHDLGKIGIPDTILKKPSRLTPEEQAIMRMHPEYGWTVIKDFPGCRTASSLILHHHEMWDGTGYPAGLKGEDIPVGARIVAITDAFDAMTTDRCYRKGMPTETALTTLERFAGTQFDPYLVPMFAKLIRSATASASESQPD
jgi:HD-GYP domain-containing protein (c-di-GMP phosphodiesterase class II)